MSICSSGMLLVTEVTDVPLVEQEPQIDSLEKVWRLCSRCLKEAIEAGLDGEARACLECQNGCDLVLKDLKVGDKMR